MLLNKLFVGFRIFILVPGIDLFILEDALSKTKSIVL